MENELDVYLEELESLRFELREFSKKYPHVASRLGANISGGMSPDVQYIVEAIAYVALKIRSEIDGAPKDLAYLIIKNIAPYLVNKRSSAAMMRVTFSPDKGLDKIPTVESSGRLKFAGKQGDLYFSYAGYNKIIPYEVSRESGGAALEKLKNTTQAKGRNIDVYLKYCGTDKLEFSGEFDIRFYLLGSRIKALKYLEKIVRGFNSCTVYSGTGVKLCELGQDCLTLEVDQKLSAVKDYNWLGWGEEFGRILANSDEISCFYIKKLKFGLGLKDIILSMNISNLTSEEANSIEESLVVNAILVENQYRHKNIIIPLKNNKTELEIPRQNDSELVWDVIKVNSVSILNGAEERVLVNADEILTSGHLLGKQLAWQEFVREKPLSKYAYATIGIRLVNYNNYEWNGPRQYLKLDCTLTNCNAPENLESGLILYDEVSGVSGEILGNFSRYHPGMIPSSIGVKQLNMLSRINNKNRNVTIEQRLSDIFNLFDSQRNDLLGLLKNCLVAVEKKYEAKSDIQMPYGTYRLVENYKCRLRGGDEWRGVSFIYSRLLKSVIGIMHDNELPFDVDFFYDNVNIDSKIDS